MNNSLKKLEIFQLTNVDEPLAHQLHQIMQEAYTNTSMNCWSIDTLKSSLKTGKLFVAKQNQEPVGFLLVQDSIDVWETLVLAVLPEVQGRGIGIKLIKDFLKNISKPVMLEVAEDNSLAIGFYQSLGFEDVTIRKNYYRNQINAKSMILINSTLRYL